MSKHFASFLVLWTLQEMFSIHCFSKYFTTYLKHLKRKPVFRFIESGSLAASCSMGSNAGPALKIKRIVFTLANSQHFLGWSKDSTLHMHTVSLSPPRQQADVVLTSKHIISGWDMRLLFLLQDLYVLFKNGIISYGTHGLQRSFFREYYFWQSPRDTVSALGDTPQHWFQCSLSLRLWCFLIATCQNYLRTLFSTPASLQSSWFL